MRWFVYGQDEAVTAWLQERFPVQTHFKDHVTIGLAEDDKLIAGAIYYNYLPQFGSINAGFAADTPNWITRGALDVFFGYPFRQLRCRRVTVCVPPSNKRMLKLVYGLGFQKEGVIRQGFGDEDMIIAGMVYKEAKRWLMKGNKNAKLSP